MPNKKIIPLVAILMLILFASCEGNNARGKSPGAPKQNVEKSVRNMADSIRIDLANNGPIAWLKYFSHSPNFFMASDGQRVLPNIDSATHFVKDFLAKDITKINLTWKNINIDSLSPIMAVLSADFHEDLFTKANQQISADGYFTSVAEETPDGWKLRNLHWSIIKK